MRQAQSATVWRKEGKQFFFEKKNQKTFICYGLQAAAGRHCRPGLGLARFSVMRAWTSS
jgi:hypothetical protein